MGLVSKFLANPNKQHWQIVNWILRYIKGTSNYCLCFGNNNVVLEGYTYENMVGDVDTRNSTIGYLCTFTGAKVSWMFRLYKLVALSTREAEYIVATEVCKEILCMQ